MEKRGDDLQRGRISPPKKLWKKKNVEIPFDFLWICNSKLRIICVNYYWFRLRFTLHNLNGQNRPFFNSDSFYNCISHFSSESSN